MDACTQAHWGTHEDSQGPYYTGCPLEVSILGLQLRECTAQTARRGGRLRPSSSWRPPQAAVAAVLLPKTLSSGLFRLACSLSKEKVF